jgi:hydroxymethylbilane synthase
MNRLRVGTRGSPLALAQSELVLEALRAGHPTLAVERVVIQTEGDRRRRASLLDLGGQGIFTRELEVALLDGEIDVAVHSLKDLPSTLPEGLLLAATPPREDPHDVLVTREGAPLSKLPAGAVVGTGSPRRRAQLLAARPDLVMEDIRGNVDTRLAKLQQGEYDAIVLAVAGLRRLGWLERPEVASRAEVLSFDTMLPAPSQGILGLECRAGDSAVRELLATVNDAGTFAAATAERAVLRRFGSGCRLPIGVIATGDDGQTRTHGRRPTTGDRGPRDDDRGTTEDDRRPTADERRTTDDGGSGSGVQRGTVGDRRLATEDGWGVLRVWARVLEVGGRRSLSTVVEGEVREAARLGEAAAARLIEGGALELMDGASLN